MKFFKLILLLFLWSGFLSVSAQEAVILQTNSGQMSFSWWNGGLSADCTDDNGQIIPDCTLSKTVANNWLRGDGTIKPFSIETSVRDAGGYSGRYFRGHSQYAMNIFAKVQSGAFVHLKIDTSMVVGWDKRINNDMSLGSSLYIRGESNAVFGCGINSNSTAGSNTCSEIVERDIQIGETPSVINGENYYFLGTLDLAGSAGMKAGVGGANASYNASVNGIDVRYKGNVLKLDNGNNQTYIVSQELPNELSVKVIDGETGAAVNGVDIIFTVIDPTNGASLSPTTVNTLDDGTAKTKLTLGSLSADYEVKATCSIEDCTSGVTEVTFTATAKTNEEATELQGSLCDVFGIVNKESHNPFRLRVFNTITGEYKSGFNISYEVTGVIDEDGVLRSEPPWPAGTSIRVQNGTTDIYGFSRAYLSFGNKEGIYQVLAKCNDCLKNQEIICVGHAGEESSLEARMEKNRIANPNDTDENGVPLTPVLRITEVNLPNDGKSFTTAVNENQVILEAELLPKWLNQNVISWIVQDAPDDYITSGTPQLLNSGGPISGFEVVVDGTNIKLAPTGRHAPLKYKVFARADIGDKTAYSRNIDVKQDEIDKCRQEYIDIPQIAEYTLDYMDKIGRNLFTVGLDGQFVGDDILDCYAHIYPSMAGEAIRLQGAVQPQLYVTSGYRSPRHNANVPGSADNSSHMFGKGVDITFANVNVNPERMQNLWDEASCPKILERSGSPIELLVCESSGEMRQDYLDLLNIDSNRDGIPDIFTEAVKLHLGE